MPVLRYYSSVAQPATLTSNINNSATSVTLSTVTGFPISFPYTLAIDWGTSTEELVDVTAAAGTTLTVTRGVDGTSAQSHGLGAAVRHVASGRDFSDYQNHQAASSAVHGITGTVVGTSDTQTLSNKTITGATFSGGGSLSGTFTGSPTLSGNPTFSGAPTFSGTATHTAPIQSTLAASSTVAHGVQVTADTFDRFQIQASGRLEWGSGSAARDVAVYREQADVLASDDSFRVYRPASTDGALTTRVVADTNSRLVIQANGLMNWGTGSAAGDTNLYRTAADTLRTDDSLQVGAALAVTGNATITGTASAAVSTATGITPAAGWTTTVEVFRQTCGVKYANITLNRSGATITTPGGSSGNVTPDLQVLSGVPAAWIPAAALYVIASTGVNSGAGRINTDGTVELTTWEPNQDIVSGANLRITWTFL